MHDLSTSLPFLEAEIAYRRERMLAHVEGRPAIRAVRPHRSRRLRTKANAGRRSWFTATRQRRTA